MVYLRGFLKSYCDYLETDFEPLWKKLVKEAAPPAVNAQTPAPQAHTGASSEPAASGWGRSAAFWLVAAAAALAAAWAVRARPSPADTPSPAPPLALAPLHSTTEPHLAIDFRDDLWLSLTVDGEMRFEGRVPRGARQDWKAKRAITLRTTAPLGLKLSLNGAHYSLPEPDSAGVYRIESP